MGPGYYAYKYSLLKLINEFKPDLRGLCPREMFHSEKHLKVLGVQQMATGLSNYDDPDPMPFARQFNFKAGPSDIRSQAIGINLWSALAIVSLLGGTDLHSSLTKTFSNHLMEIILSHSPSGFTPGNISPGFDYDQVTTKPLKFYFSSENRPNHFWRPENPAFVNSGVLAIAPAFGRFLPEDCFALPLPDIAKTLHCDVMEVPGNAFTVSERTHFSRGVCVATDLFSFLDHADPGAGRLVFVSHPALHGRRVWGHDRSQRGGLRGDQSLHQGPRAQGLAPAQHGRMGRFPPQGEHGGHAPDQAAGRLRLSGGLGRR
jgi:hypothetical protein